MTAEPVPKLQTPARIAEALDVPLHRVLWILKTREHIHPAATAGGTRCYDREAVAMIRHELSTIDARRGTMGGAA